MTVQLKAPLLSDGLKSINFFNGRLLSAEDLNQEQAANKLAHQFLGQAVGEGVAYGFEVQKAIGVSTASAPVVTVQAGLAVNRLGQTLRLPTAVDIALVRPSPNGNTFNAGLFAECEPTQAGQYVAGAGVYLLTIQPASGTDGKAPVSGLGNLDAACNAKYQVDGAQFHLLQLSLTQELNDTNRLRNRLAYRCFGAGDSRVTSFFSNPFGISVSQYGLLDDLRPNCLKDEAVPLALLYWTAVDGLKFVDMWSARRRLTRAAADARWPLLTSDRRVAEAEAMFLQFENQIEEMRNDPGENLGTLTASDRFKYLPSVGLLPINGQNVDLLPTHLQNSLSGFNWQTFFGDLAPETLDVMDVARLPALIHESFNHQPLAVNETASRPLTLYLLRENVEAVQANASIQLTVVFARLGVAYSGVTRFDYARWGVSHFH